MRPASKRGDRGELPLHGPEHGVGAARRANRAVVGTQLDRERLERILRGFSERADIPPVPIFREPGAARATLLDGMHRCRASEAVGYHMIPALEMIRDDAEVLYRYKAPPG